MTACGAQQLKSSAAGGVGSEASTSRAASPPRRVASCASQRLSESQHGLPALPAARSAARAWLGLGLGLGLGLRLGLGLGLVSWRMAARASGERRIVLSRPS